MSTTFHEPINNVSDTVASNRTSGSASLVVTSGAQFGSTFPLIVTIARSGTVLCLLEVTGRSSNTLTVSGAIEGTTDQNLVVGDVVQMRPTALTIAEIQVAVNAAETAIVSRGVPTGQVLAKASSADFDTHWVAAGGRGSPAGSTGHLHSNTSGSFDASSNLYYNAAGGYLGFGASAGEKIRLYDSVNEYGFGINSFELSIFVATSAVVAIYTGGFSGTAIARFGAAHTHLNTSGCITGNLGVGTSSPGAPLSFGASTGDKILLYDAGSRSHGCGVASYEWSLFAPSAASFVFRTRSGGTERFRIAAGGVVLPTLADAGAIAGSIYLGSDHLHGNSAPKPVRSDAG